MAKTTELEERVSRLERIMEHMHQAHMDEIVEKVELATPLTDGTVAEEETEV